MALAPGTRVGPYEILSAVAAGGMGEVYRAHDTKLNRDVAIKVLPSLFASDAERLARFTREAHTLASLNHPNIAHIHGLEESGGVRALVMELVEGEDLTQRSGRGAIPLDEALPIAKQIAEARRARPSPYRATELQPHRSALGSVAAARSPLCPPSRTQRMPAQSRAGVVPAE